MKQATQPNPLMVTEGIGTALAIQAVLKKKRVPCKVVPLSAVSKLPPFPGTLITVGS